MGRDHRNPNARPSNSQPTGNARRGNSNARRDAVRSHPVVNVVRNIKPPRFTPNFRGRNNTPTASSNTPVISRIPNAATTTQRVNDIILSNINRPKTKKLYVPQGQRNGRAYNFNTNNPDHYRALTQSKDKKKDKRIREYSTHGTRAKEIEDKDYVYEVVETKRNIDKIDILNDRLKDGYPKIIPTDDVANWTPEMRLKYDPLTGIRRDLLDVAPLIKETGYCPDELYDLFGLGLEMEGGAYSLGKDDKYFKNLNDKNYYEELIYNPETGIYEPMRVIKMNAEMPALTGDIHLLGNYNTNFTYSYKGERYKEYGAPEAPFAFDEEGNIITNYDKAIMLSDGTWVTGNYTDADLQRFKDAWTTYCMLSNAAAIPSRKLTEKMRYTAGWDRNETDSWMDIGTDLIADASVRNYKERSRGNRSGYYSDTASVAVPHLFKNVGHYLKTYLFTPLSKGDMQTALLNGLVNLAETCDYAGMGTRALLAPKLGLEYNEGDNAWERVAKAYTTHYHYEPDTGSALKDIGIYMIDPSIVTTLGFSALAKLSTRTAAKMALTPLRNRLINFGEDITKYDSALKREYKAIARDITTADDKALAVHAERVADILNESETFSTKFATADDILNELRDIQNKKNFLLVRGAVSASNITNAIDTFFLAGGLYLPYSVLKTVKGTRSILRSNERIAKHLKSGMFDKFENAQRIYKNYSGSGSILDYRQIIEGFKSIRSLDASETLKYWTLQKMRRSYMHQERNFGRAIVMFKNSKMGFTNKLAMFNDAIAKIFRNLGAEPPKNIDELERILTKMSADSNGSSQAGDDIFKNILSLVEDAKKTIDLVRTDDADHWIEAVTKASSSTEVQDIYKTYLVNNSAHPVANMEELVSDRYRMLYAAEHNIDVDSVELPDDMIVKAAIANDLDYIPTVNTSAKPEPVSSDVTVIPHCIGDAHEVNRKNVIKLKNDLEGLVVKDEFDRVCYNKRGEVELLADTYYVRDLYNYLHNISENEISLIVIDELMIKVGKAFSSLEGKFGADLSKLPDAEALAKHIEASKKADDVGSINDLDDIFIYSGGAELQQKLVEAGALDYFHLVHEVVEDLSNYLPSNIPKSKLRDKKLSHEIAQVYEETQRAAKREAAADPNGLKQQKLELKHKLMKTEIKKPDGVVTTAYKEYEKLVHEFTTKAAGKEASAGLRNTLDITFSDLVDSKALAEAEAERVKEVNMTLSTFLNKVFEKPEILAFINDFSETGKFGFLIENKDEICSFIEQNIEAGREVPQLDNLHSTLSDIEVWRDSLDAYIHFYNTISALKLSPRTKTAVLEYCIGRNASHLAECSRDAVAFSDKMMEGIQKILGPDNLHIDTYRETVLRTSFIDESVWNSKHLDHVLACEKEIAEISESDVKLQMLQAVEMAPENIARFNKLAESNGLYFLKVVTEDGYPGSAVVRIEMQKWTHVEEDASLPELLNAIKDEGKENSYIFEISEKLTEEEAIKNVVEILDKGIKTGPDVKFVKTPFLFTHGKNFYDIDALRQCCYRNNVVSASLSNTNRLFQNSKNTYKELMRKGKGNVSIDPDQLTEIQTALFQFLEDKPDDAFYSIFNLNHFDKSVKELFDIFHDPDFAREITGIYDCDNPVIKELSSREDSVKALRVDDYEEEILKQDLADVLDRLFAPEEGVFNVEKNMRMVNEGAAEENLEVTLAQFDAENRIGESAPEYFGVLNHVSASFASVRNTLEDLSNIMREFYYGVREGATSKEILDAVVEKYPKYFKSRFDTNFSEFNNYYREKKAKKEIGYAIQAEGDVRYLSNYRDKISQLLNYSIKNGPLPNLNNILKELDNTFISGTDISLSSLISNELKKELSGFMHELNDLGFEVPDNVFASMFRENPDFSVINAFSDILYAIEKLLPRLDVEFNLIKRGGALLENPVIKRPEKLAEYRNTNPKAYRKLVRKSASSSPVAKLVGPKVASTPKFQKTHASYRRVYTGIRPEKVDIVKKQQVSNFTRSLENTAGVLSDTQSLCNELSELIHVIDIDSFKVIETVADKEQMLLKLGYLDVLVSKYGNNVAIPEAVTNTLTVFSSALGSLKQANKKELKQFVDYLVLYKDALYNMLTSISKPDAGYKTIYHLDTVFTSYNQESAILQQELLNLQNNISNRIFRQSINVTEETPFIRDIFNPSLEKIYGEETDIYYNTFHSSVEELNHIRAAQTASVMTSKEFEGFGEVCSNFDLPMGSSSELRFAMSGNAYSQKKVYDHDNASRIFDIDQERETNRLVEVSDQVVYDHSSVPDATIIRQKSGVMQETAELVEEVKRLEADIKETEDIIDEELKPELERLEELKALAAERQKKVYELEKKHPAPEAYKKSLRGITDKKTLKGFRDVANKLLKEGKIDRDTYRRLTKNPKYRFNWYTNPELAAQEKRVKEDIFDAIKYKTELDNLDKDLAEQGVSVSDLHERDALLAKRKTLLDNRRSLIEERRDIQTALIEDYDNASGYADALKTDNSKYRQQVREEMNEVLKLRLRLRKINAEELPKNKALLSKNNNDIAEVDEVLFGLGERKEALARDMRDLEDMKLKKAEVKDKMINNYEMLKKTETSDSKVVERILYSDIQRVLEESDDYIHVKVNVNDIPLHERNSLSKFANQACYTLEHKLKGAEFLEKISTIDDWKYIINETKKYALALPPEHPYHYLVYIKEPETIEEAFVVADMLYNMFYKKLEVSKTLKHAQIEKGLEQISNEYKDIVSRIMDEGLNSVRLDKLNPDALRILKGDGLDLIYKGYSPAPYFDSVYYNSKISGKHSAAANVEAVLESMRVREGWAKKFASINGSIRENAFAELENSQIEALEIIAKVAGTPYEHACRVYLNNLHEGLIKAQTLRVMDWITQDTEHLITHLLYHNHRLVLPTRFSDDFQVYGTYLTKLREMLSDYPLYIEWKEQQHQLWISLSSDAEAKIINDTKYVKSDTKYELGGKEYEATEMNKYYDHIALPDDIAFTEGMFHESMSGAMLTDYCSQLRDYIRKSYSKLDFLTEGAIKGSAITPFTAAKNRALRKAFPIDLQAKSIRQGATCDQRLFHTSQFDFSILGESEYRLKLGGCYDDTDILQNIKHCYDDLAGTVSTERMYIANYFDENSHCRLENVFGPELTTVDKLAILKNNPDQCVLTITADEQTLTGFRVNKVRITDELSIEEAEAAHAIIADYETYVEMTRLINNSEFDKTWMKAWARIVFLLKVGHLCNPGTWIRNWMDATVKSTSATGDLYNIGKVAMDQFRAIKYLIDYNRLIKYVRDNYGIHHNTSKRIVDDWDAIQLKAGTKLTKEQFDFLEGWLNVSLSGGESRMLREMLAKQKYDPFRSGNLKPGNSFTSAGRQEMKKQYDYLGSDIFRFEQIGEDEITRLIEEGYRKGEQMFADDFSVEQFWQIFNQRKNPKTAYIEDNDLFQKYVETVTNILTLRSRNLFRGNQSLGSKFDFMCSTLLKPMSMVEQVVRLGQFLTLEKEGFTRSEIFKSIADTQFEYELKSSRIKYAELGITYFNFEYNNVRYWCDMLEKQPEFVYVLENFWGDLSWNAAQEYYEDEDIYNNKSIAYMMANGALPIGSTGLYLKTFPSALGALNWFYGMPSQFMTSVVPPIELLAKEFGYNMGGDYAQWMSNLDFSYADEKDWEKALSLVPIAGTFYTRYIQHVSERQPWKRLDDDFTLGRLLSHYNPTVWGAVYQQKNNKDDYDAFLKELEKQGKWYDLNKSKVVDIEEKNEHGLNNPDFKGTYGDEWFNRLCEYKRIFKNEAWDKNWGGFVKMGYFTTPGDVLFDKKGNPKELGLNRERDFNVPGEWEKYEEDMFKYHGRKWDKNTDKFIPFWLWKNEKLNRDNLSFPELQEYMAEKGKYWDSIDHKFKSAPEDMRIFNWNYYYKGWRNFRRWVNYGNYPPAQRYDGRRYMSGIVSKSSNRAFRFNYSSSNDHAAMRMATTGYKSYDEYYKFDYKYNYRYRMPNPLTHVKRYNPIIRYHINPS